MGRKAIIAFENVDIDTKKFLVTRSNPQYWKRDGVRNKFEYVFAPNYPEIEKAYYDAGKKIYRPDPNDEKSFTEDAEPAPVPSKEESVEEISQASEVEDASESVNASSVEENEGEDGEPHWSELSWPKMRSKASQLTDEPISSKEFAKEVLQNAEDEGKI
jgi:hypothetical protein